MENEEFWRIVFEEPSVSFFKDAFNVVDTNKYDIINGKPVERKEYKKKRLEKELADIKDQEEYYEKALIDKTKRKAEIKKELKDL